MWRESWFLQQLRGYFRGRESLAGQPLPEVRKALIEDAPRLVRLTIWSLLGFFIFLRKRQREQDAIPSSRKRGAQ